ncbi:ankyrin, partial [Gonapodya prolifera JEL478]
MISHAGVPASVGYEDDGGGAGVDSRGRRTTTEWTARAARLRISPSRLFRPPPQSVQLVPPSFPSSMTIKRLAGDSENDLECENDANGLGDAAGRAGNEREILEGTSTAPDRALRRGVLEKAAHLLGAEVLRERFRRDAETRPSKLVDDEPTLPYHPTHPPTPPPPPLTPSYTTTFVHHACTRGDLSALLFSPSAASPFLEHPDEQGRTPLALAAMGGHEEVVAVLVTGKAEGKVARRRAASLGGSKAKEGGWKRWMEEVVIRAPLPLQSILPPITHSLNLPDPTGRTPAHWAALLGHYTVLRTLRRTAGPRVRWLQPDAAGRTVVHLAVMGEDESRAEECLREVIAAVEEAAQGGDSAARDIGATGWWRWPRGVGRRVSVSISSAAAAARRRSRSRSHLGPLGVSTRGPGATSPAPSHLSHRQSPSPHPTGDLARLALNLPDAQGMTPAHLACALDRTRVLGVLVSTGKVGLDATDADGKTAFHWAAGVRRGGGHASRVASAGGPGDGRSRSWSAQTQSHIGAGVGAGATVEDDSCCAIVVLRIAPQLAHLEDHEGRTALHLAALANTPLLVDALCALKSVNLDARDSAGRTPLHWAAVCGHAQLVARMVALGCDPGVGDATGGATAVHYAAAKNHAGCVGVLMDGKGEESEGGDLQKRGGRSMPRGYKGDNHGRTPLHWAAERGHVQAVRVMVKEECLERGVDPNAGDGKGATALHVAAGAGHTTVTAVLLELRVPPGSSPSRTASESMPTSSSSYLVNPDVLDHSGQTPLFRAVIAGHADIAALLCSAGARLDISDAEGRTVLHHAAWRGDLQMVSVLTARARAAGGGGKGKSASKDGREWLVGARDEEGRTALMLAAAAGWDDVVKYLHENGAWDLDEQDDVGLSAMHLAVCTRKVSTVALLIKLGANPNLLDRPYPFVPVRQSNATSRPASMNAPRDLSHSATTRNSVVSGVSSVYADTTDEEQGRPQNPDADVSPPRTALDLADELGDEEMYDLIRRNGGWPGSVMVVVEVAVRVLQRWWRDIMALRENAARKWDDERAAARLPPSAAPLHRAAVKLWDSAGAGSMTTVEREYFGGAVADWQDDAEATDSGTAVSPGGRAASTDSPAVPVGESSPGMVLALPPLPGSIRVVESTPIKASELHDVGDEDDDGMTTMERWYFEEAARAEVSELDA